MCADHVDHDRSDKLKAALRQYFDEQPEIKDGQVTLLSFAREYGSQDQASVLEPVSIAISQHALTSYIATCLSFIVIRHFTLKERAILLKPHIQCSH